MRQVFKQKAKAYKNLKKAKVVSRCLAVKKKIMEAEIKLKEFYDKRVKVEEDKIFNRAKLDKDVLMKYIK